MYTFTPVCCFWAKQEFSVSPQHSLQDAYALPLGSQESLLKPRSIEQQEVDPKLLFSQLETFLFQHWPVPRVQAFWGTARILLLVAAIPQLSATQLWHMVQWVKSTPAWYKRDHWFNLYLIYTTKLQNFSWMMKAKEESRAYFLQERAVPYSHTGNSLHMLEMNQTFLMKKPRYPNVLSQSVFSWLGQNCALQMPGVCAVI